MVTRTARWLASIGSSSSASLVDEIRAERGAERPRFAVRRPPARPAIPSVQSDRCRFGEETFAVASRNGSNAPFAAIRHTAINRVT